MYCTLYIYLCTVHCTYIYVLYTVHISMYCTLYIYLCTVYCTYIYVLYTVHCTDIYVLYTVHSTDIYVLYTVHIYMYCTLYIYLRTVHCIYIYVLHTVQVWCGCTGQGEEGDPEGRDPQGLLHIRGRGGVPVQVKGGTEIKTYQSRYRGAQKKRRTRPGTGRVRNQGVQHQIQRSIKKVYHTRNRGDYK